LNAFPTIKGEQHKLVGFHVIEMFSKQPESVIDASEDNALNIINITAGTTSMDRMLWIIVVILRSPLSLASFSLIILFPGDFLPFLYYVWIKLIHVLGHIFWFENFDIYILSVGAKL
jgi:hypothetical protein